MQPKMLYQSLYIAHLSKRVAKFLRGVAPSPQGAGDRGPWRCTRYNRYLSSETLFLIFLYIARNKYFIFVFIQWKQISFDIYSCKTHYTLFSVVQYKILPKTRCLWNGLLGFHNKAVLLISCLLVGLLFVACFWEVSFRFYDKFACNVISLPVSFRLDSETSHEIAFLHVVFQDWWCKHALTVPCFESLTW